MTASGGAGQRMSGAAMARAWTIVDNARAGLAVLVRQPRRIPARFVPAWRRLPGWGIAVLVVVVLSMMFVDAAAYQWASGLPDWMVDTFFAITDFGRSGWILVPTGVLVILIAVLASPALDFMTRAVLAMVVTRLGFMFIAVGLPGLVSTVVKRWIGRVRPSASGPFAYEPFSWRAEFASLPSGHATTAFAALVAIGLVFPRARPLLWTYALLIAVSRIVVAAHYPSDVVAGAAVGVFGALWVRDWFAVRRLGFHIGVDGVVHVGPGPSWRRIKQVAGAVLAP